MQLDVESEEAPSDVLHVFKSQFSLCWAFRVNTVRIEGDVLSVEYARVNRNKDIWVLLHSGMKSISTYGWEAFLPEESIGYSVRFRYPGKINLFLEGEAIL